MFDYLKQNESNNIKLFLFFFLNFSLFTSSPVLINLTFILISIITIYYFKLEIFKKIEIIIFLLFILLILFSTYVSNIPSEEKTSALGWIKIILLLIFINYLIDVYNLKNYSRFSRFILYLIYFLIIDTFLQRFLNLEFFGNEIIIGRTTDPYSDELIIGGIILVIGFVPVILKLFEYLNKNKFIKSLFLLNLYFISIFITGERMNTLLSWLGIFILILFLFKHKKFIFSFLIIYFFNILHYNDL